MKTRIDHSEIPNSKPNLLWISSDLAVGTSLVSFSQIYEDSDVIVRGNRILIYNPQVNNLDVVNDEKTP